ncbi:VanZ family protein [Paenibacillus phocaensis]|uniref:VanZ family protein n=1 Tax=Paenibacillus phocaensis TaxID=1776378 RepID=UPI000839D325|nr:VanZ family protein [Paenibacillus phocaensis]
MHNLRPWLRWLPAIAMMAILFGFSSQSYQEQSLVPEIEKNTSDHTIADWFGGIRFSYGGHEISVASVGGASFIEFFIRKAAHFGSYALLAAFLVYALGGRVRSTRRRLLYAILIAFLYACTDELHQSLTPGRTALVQDVVLDTVGAACGAAFTMLLNRWRGSGRQRRA